MIRIRLAEPDDTPRAFDIWREAVLATHGFLSPEDFRQISQLVAERYLPQAPLWLAVDSEDRPLAFMGLSGGGAGPTEVPPRPTPYRICTTALFRSSPLCLDPWWEPPYV